ncbi:MAG: exodeoxyribonuclease VII small subunit [Acetatifactor sp.]|nr:exodeoxyribonuclease VII small subunit [Acetatifactor sp.]
MSEEQKAYTLEENFERLEQVISILEKEDVPLEEAFRAYQKGMGIVKLCNDEIDRVEKQVLKLTEDGCLEEFTSGED